MRKFNKNELVIVRPGCDHAGKAVCIKDAGFIIAKGVKTSSVVFDYRTTPPDPNLGDGLAMEHQLRRITEPHAVMAEPFTVALLGLRAVSRYPQDIANRDKTK